MLNVLFHPAVTGLVTEFRSVLWILCDKKDRTLLFLVPGLVANLFDGWLLALVWGGRAGLRRGSESITSHPACRVRTSREHRQRARAHALSAPWGLSSHGSHDDCLVPRGAAKSHLGIPCLAYVAEMVTGAPCSTQSFRMRSSLRPSRPVVTSTCGTGGLSGMPNAFPSLRWYWCRLRAVADDLDSVSRGNAHGDHRNRRTLRHRPVAGLAFGCFAANAGRLRIARSQEDLGLRDPPRIFLWCSVGRSPCDSHMTF
jgi:hypothetical protein